MASAVPHHGEVVAWLRHDNGHARLQHLVDLDRAAAALVLAQDPDQILGRICWIAGEAELADELGRYRDVDMGAGFIGGQRLPIARDDLEQVDLAVG